MGYVVEVAREDLETLLDSWRWLVGSEASVLLVTAAGDAAVTKEGGSVWLLDTCAGTFSRVAKAREEFDQQIQSRKWLNAELVDDLRAAGVRLKRGQCYSFKLPPAMGGDPNDIDNIEPATVQVHFGLMGQVHEQIRSLPDGEVINSFEGSEP